ncbi:hypothetical protein ARAM_001696 [Aspergillus rambellii]|uniref:endo-1,3(4)-beta-glucanase n=1 Tax=Aspergillus rambellii TaxID=308745 RepID=A0A0F8UQL4_9EURO|nr:hypothetical protein ARAM_001696 [Aspergillus rambellii]
MNSTTSPIPGDNISRYAGAPAHIPKMELDTIQHPGLPWGSDKPSPSALAPRRPWYNPRGWSPQAKLFAGSLCIAVMIGVIVGTVKWSELSRYPDYSPLNYRLVDTYAGTSFFDQFHYFSDPDPTYGFVQYVNESTALALNLTYATDLSATIKVDTTRKNPISGRQSVRIESKATYDTGLFLFDILHSPYGCGTWPALWLTDGYHWPVNGEIDVLEANNKATDGNEMTLHTTAGCSMDVRRKQSGQTVFTTCDNSTNGNAGCGVQGPALSYGKEFNDNGGGIYALELRAAGIRAWFFPRNLIPADITNGSGTPDPSSWGLALADFPNTSCDIPSHFKNQSIIANIDLCGQLGANAQFYTTLYGCPGECKDFVAHNPGNFTDAYWEFSSFKIYQAL